MPSPIEKLQVLADLVKLVVAYLSSTSGSHVLRPRASRLSLNSVAPLSSAPHTPFSSAEKTLSQKGSVSALKPLGETIATVEVKRNSPLIGSSGYSNEACFNSLAPNTDAIAGELRSILKTFKPECKTLFRDLQFIAAFVPANVLDMTDIGKAFWDMSIAALSVKKEYLKTIVQTASDLFASTERASTNTNMFYSVENRLEDSVRLFSIAAMEGDVNAQRELGLMFMSHPEITPICVAPFSKSSEIHENLNQEDFRMRQDRDKINTIKLAVAKHWMDQAAAQGDRTAEIYVNQLKGF